MVGKSTPPATWERGFFIFKTEHSTAAWRGTGHYLTVLEAIIAFRNWAGFPNQIRDPSWMLA
jgi:hypothetical protein